MRIEHLRFQRQNIPQRKINPNSSIETKLVNLLKLAPPNNPPETVYAFCEKRQKPDRRNTIVKTKFFFIIDGLS
jgi:hypothetical protein